MNTLPRDITRSWFGSESDYTALTRHWSAAVRGTASRAAIGPEHHLLYLALRGRDWRRAFTPITNERKIDNGAFYDWGLHRALPAIHSEWEPDRLLAPFGGRVSREALARVRALLPQRVDSFDPPYAYPNASMEVAAHV